MGVKQDRDDEAQRIEERNRRIEQILLHPTDSKVEAVQDCKETAPHRTYYGRPLRPYERVNARGMVEQYRPASLREQEQDNDAAFMESQKRQTEEHSKKVKQAERENQQEQKRLDDQRKHEQTTGRRPLRDPNRISLDEARKRGYLQSENESNGMPEYWSPGNPDGILGGGR